METLDLMQTGRLAETGGLNGYTRKAAAFRHPAEAVRQLGLYWLLPDQPPEG
jgi:hypothetical protein